MSLTKEELAWAEQYWNSANYLAAAAIYLKDNFLLERKLKKDDIKRALLGHWGTCPGINFIYTHLNLLASKRTQEILLVLGPGHGFAASLANLFLERSLEKYYSHLTHTKEGIGRLIKSFCWPGGFPSHINPGVPGCIHEGGELGYALGTAFGAAFDNPKLLVAAIIGDGEAETGPTATAWHSTKFLNPASDGAVLPILHLNGYKINNPSIYGTMSDSELKALFTGYGYEPLFVSASHEVMYSMLERAYQRIEQIQKDARAGKRTAGMRWPMLIVQTPKGWSGIKKLRGVKIEGSWRSHQVPVKDVRENPESLRALERWLQSYKPKKLFPEGRVPATTLRFIPKDTTRIGANKHALGGSVRKPLVLPEPEKFAVAVYVKKRGAIHTSTMSVFGGYLCEVMRENQKTQNFRIVSPDELASNRLDAVLKETGRAYSWKDDDDCALAVDGRVMEMLSEHTLQSWLQGYVLTGRHGIFPSYEAFLPIVDSMVSQYLKFIVSSLAYPWRKPVSALNYILTSVCWRQDHNGFSHQNPGFITTLLNKSREEKLVRLYFPADANMLLVVGNWALQSTNRVNAIVADKYPTRQWLTYAEAAEQAKQGAGIWDFASSDNPDVVLAACGDYQTQELLATIKLLREHAPKVRVRFVNVSELNVLGTEEQYPNALSNAAFEKLFTADKQIFFSFHGYPDTVKQLLFGRCNPERLHVVGYTEQGTTTTPFDMLVRNGVSRYQIAPAVVAAAAKSNRALAKNADALSAWCAKKLAEHKAYILREGHDPEEIDAWSWQ
jgi:xylulose-5-phosphate/fructose-6-phosphate phosphoketolase